MGIETADRWYEVRTLDDGIVHIQEPHILPFYRCNIRFVHGRQRSLLVDNRHRRAPCAGFGLSQDGHRTWWRAGALVARVGARLEPGGQASRAGK